MNNTSKHIKLYKTIIIPILGLFLILASGKAQNYSELFNSANELYKKGQYDTAINVYKKIIEKGYESADIYYNIANAYYKTRNIPKAILYYEKALLLRPNDEEIKYNLQLAQTMIVDKINVLPEFFLKRFWRDFQKLLSSNSWAIFSLSFFIIALITFIIYLFSKTLFIKKTFFYFFVIFFIFSAISFSNSYNQKVNIEKKDTAIIMAGSVTVKSSPDDNGTELFVIHEGTKVWLIDELGEWVNIKIADGNKGWIKKDDLELI